MRKVFNKGLKEEGLLKRLKNVEGKNEGHLKAIKYLGEKQLKKQNKEVDFRNMSFKNKLNLESTKVFDDIKEQNKKIYYTKIACKGSAKH